MDSLFDKLKPLLALAARALMSCIFVVSGWEKIAHYAGAGRFMDSIGVPAALLPLVIAVEFGGSLALLAGFRTRLVALLLAGFALLAATLVHFHPGDHENMIVFMDNLAMVGGLLMFVQHGGGAWSIDGRLRGRRAGWSDRTA
jgi:putative oxidoreductase